MRRRDQRWGVRTAIRLPVACSEIGVTGARREPFLGETLDVSATGVCFVAQRRVSVGSLVVVSLRLDDPPGATVTAATAVVRVTRRADGFLIAVRFDDVAPEARAELGRFLVRALAREAGSAADRRRVDRSS